MIDFIKYFQFYILWIFLFIIYFIIFLQYDLTIYYPFMFSYAMASWIGTFVDILKKDGGDSRFYCYSKEINQKLRYLVFILISIFVIVGHKFLLCDKLKLIIC